VPRLNRLHEELGAEGLVLIGLNTENLRPGALRSLADNLGITFTVVRPESPLPDALRPAGPLPQTWWIDRAGLVRATRVGMVPEGQLHRVCTGLLQER
jgi:hypothetical protein